jgi:hypothetical protein
VVEGCYLGCECAKCRRMEMYVALVMDLLGEDAPAVADERVRRIAAFIAERDTAPYDGRDNRC